MATYRFEPAAVPELEEVAAIVVALRQLVPSEPERGEPPAPSRWAEAGRLEAREGRSLRLRLGPRWDSSR
ncbi:MAG: hypothetical protein M3281_06110 [Chloroflexota bacterium]|nr:hypothetical protein [Chloroflexota bacterium]